MARRITQKQLKTDEFVDGVVGMEQWMEDNWRSVATWAAIAIVLAVGIVGWLGWSRHKIEEANDIVARGISEYQQAELGGFADVTGLTSALGTFDEAIRSAGGSKPGLVASYYRGATLYRMDRFDEARGALEGVVSKAPDGDTLRLSAQMLLARVQVASGSPDQAIATLETIVGQEDAVVSPDQALVEIGRIQKGTGQEEAAKATWQRVIDEHPQSAGAFEARQLLQ